MVSQEALDVDGGAQQWINIIFWQSKVLFNRVGIPRCSMAFIHRDMMKTMPWNKWDPPSDYRWCNIENGGMYFLCLPGRKKSTGHCLKINPVSINPCRLKKVFTGVPSQIILRLPVLHSMQWKEPSSWKEYLGVIIPVRSLQSSSFFSVFRGSGREAFSNQSLSVNTLQDKEAWLAEKTKSYILTDAFIYLILSNIKREAFSCCRHINVWV